MVFVGEDSREKMMSSSKQSKGAWYVGLSYALWGFFPIYWKALAGISAASAHLPPHRLVVPAARRDDRAIAGVPRRCGKRCSRRASSIIYTVAALAIASNWLIFVWAVSINQIVQISLGYFINPLLSVVFGMVVFHERLRRLQWVSVALAAAGVVYLTVALDAFPWIALSLAASFGTYGLMKKLAPLGPVQGLTFETGILFIPAAVYLIVEAARRTRRLHARRAASQHA